MKNKNIIIVFVILSILLASFMIIAKSSEKANKLDERASEALAKEGKAKVIVVLKETSSKKEKASMIANAKSAIKDEKKIKHEFSSFNGFSASLTEEEINSLLTDDDVEGIYYDEPVHALLQDSVPLIEADDVWNIQQNSINLTGAGQTICIIDTGINYSHNDLGGCEIEQLTLDGDVSNLSSPVQSAHNYANNLNYLWQINGSNFTNIAVHFVNISTENHFDYVEILDGNKNTLASYSGSHTDLWSPSVSGDKIYVKLVTDESVVGYGFYIDQIINGTTNTTYDWDSCSKVISGWDIVNADGNPMDDDGHGTHVAGIAAADGDIKGVAPGANLIAIKALDDQGNGYSSDIARGIEWCTNNSQKYNISVISMSVGGNNTWSSYCDSNPNYTAYKTAINAAVAKNIPVVVATGNYGNTTHISAPACIQNATPVASSTKADAVSSFSNRNNMTLLIAPGTDINSTCIDGDYCEKDGTSMATPHVSGAIALIRQYLDDINAQKTPSQIESALNLTGETIDDSAGSGLNYSRINVLDAILSLDSQNPDVTLASPSNNILDSEENQTFTCNATDIQLKNMTFYLWNASNGQGLVNSTSLDVSGTSNETEITIYNLPDGRYRWNCYYCDDAGAYSGGTSNCAYATSNFTFTIGDISMTLNSPSNNTYTKITSRTFNCTSQTADDLELTNTTFYLWHSNGTLRNSTTTTISGTTNSTLFNYTFASNADDKYYWNCLVYNNLSESTWAVKNYTITFDNDNPDVTLTFPADGASSYKEDQDITFKYTVGDDISEIDECQLIFDDEEEDSDSSITKDSTQQFTASFSSDGDHTWGINCTDDAGNYDYAERDIDLQKATTTTSDGSSSDRTYTFTSTTQSSTTQTNSNSQTTQRTVYNPTKEETVNGYTAELQANDKITFILEVEKEMNSTNGTEIRRFNESHSITLAEVNNESAIITVASEPFNVTLNIGNEKKINVSSADYYEIYVKLNNITIEDNQTKANITIQTIYEPMSSLAWLSNAWQSFINWIKRNYVWILIVLGIIIFFIATVFTEYCILCKLMRKKSPIKTKEFSRYESYHMPKKSKKAEASFNLNTE